MEAAFPHLVDRVFGGGLIGTIGVHRHGRHRSPSNAVLYEISTHHPVAKSSLTLKWPRQKAFTPRSLSLAKWHSPPNIAARIYHKNQYLFMTPLLHLYIPLSKPHGANCPNSLGNDMCPTSGSSREPWLPRAASCSESYWHIAQCRL